MIKSLSRLQIIAYIKLIIVMIIWGSNYHFAKYAVQDTDIYTVAFIRFIYAGIILLLIYHNKHRRWWPKKNITVNWSIICLAGLFGIFTYNLLFFAAESFISANNVAILFAFTPCLTVILSKLFLRQRVNIITYCGILLALLGAIMVVSLSEAKCDGSFICINLLQHLSSGQILAILASFAMAVYNIFNKQASNLKIDPLELTTFSTIFGALLLFISYILFADPLIKLLNKSLNFWLIISYISIFSTVLGYKWYSESIHYIGINQTSIFLNCVPLFAIITGAIFFHEFINYKILLAGLLTIIGVIITNYSINSLKHA